MQTKNRKAWWRGLQRLGSCSEAVEYAKTQRTFSAAWKGCQRGDWMLWIVGRGVKCEPWTDGRKKLTAAAIDCVRIALPYTGKGREEIAKHLDTIAAWTQGTATVEAAQAAREGISIAWRAAADAAYAAYADAAYAYAAYAYAYAAYAATYAATYAAADAYAYAAAAAAAADAYAAAAAAAADATRSRVLSECADIVRKHFQRPPRLTTK